MKLSEKIRRVIPMDTPREPWMELLNRKRYGEYQSDTPAAGHCPDEIPIGYR